MRPTWKGFMSFGLVTIPVHLYSAIDQHEETKFNLLHSKDQGRIRYKRTCESCGEEVAWGDIVKGFEHADGQWVTFTDDDFDKADVQGSSTIDIQEFVKAPEIDPKFFERPCYLEPQKGGERPFALLRDALKKADKVGVAKLVMRSRQHLCCIKPDGLGIVLEIMRFADEVRPQTELKLPPVEEGRPKELELAERLIDGMTGPFDITRYKDDYREKLDEIIREKIAGLPPAPVGEAPAPTRVADLMAVLEKSLAERTGKSAAPVPAAVAPSAAIGKPTSKSRASGRAKKAKKED
ncbi:MAG TPA: Ku protein [Planctomycetota bacterium]|nr:Ku protein [Planctomycetota bacterium]